MDVCTHDLMNDVPEVSRGFLHAFKKIVWIAVCEWNWRVRSVWFAKERHNSNAKR